MLGHGQKALGDFCRRRQALFAVIEGFVGQAPGHRFVAVQAVAQQEQARGTGMAEPAWQQQAGAKFGAQADVDERHAQLGVAGDQYLIAMQQQRGANADGRPADCRDQRFLQARDDLHQVERRGVQMSRRVLEEIHQVIAAGKARRATGDDDHAGLRVFVGGQQQLGQLRVHGVVQRIELVRAVDGQRQHAVALLVFDQVGHRRLCRVGSGLPL
ncbi:hypothetical protein D9M71_401900 [compost metagenome]